MGRRNDGRLAAYRSECVASRASPARRRFSRSASVNAGTLTEAASANTASKSGRMAFAGPPPGRAIETAITRELKARTQTLSTSTMRDMNDSLTRPFSLVAGRRAKGSIVGGFCVPFLTELGKKLLNRAYLPASVALRCFQPRWG